MWFRGPKSNNIVIILYVFTEVGLHWIYLPCEEWWTMLLICPMLNTSVACHMQHDDFGQNQHEDTRGVVAYIKVDMLPLLQDVCWSTTISRLTPQQPGFLDRNRPDVCWHSTPRHTFSNNNVVLKFLHYVSAIISHDSERETSTDWRTIYTTHISIYTHMWQTWYNILQCISKITIFKFNIRVVHELKYSVVMR